MSSSKARQKFHVECEEAINRQINMELYASYVYLSMVNMNFYMLSLYTCDITDITFILHAYIKLFHI